MWACSSSAQLISVSQCSRDHPVASVPQETAGSYQSVLHLKRTTRTSPIHSPTKLTRSPCPKCFKRARTFSEAHELHSCEKPTSQISSFQSELFWSWLSWRYQEVDIHLHVSKTIDWDRKAADGHKVIMWHLYRCRYYSRGAVNCTIPFHSGQVCWHQRSYGGGLVNAI